MENMQAMVNYFNANKASEYALVFRGLTNEQKSHKKTDSLNALVFTREWVECNWELFVKLFAKHAGQMKTVDVVINKAVAIIAGSYNALGKMDGVKLLSIEGVTYANIPLDKNGTRATELEKIVCTKLGYKWCGGLKNSALYTTDRVYNVAGEYVEYTRKISNARTVVPDGYKDVDGKREFLEVKCVRGRFVKD